MEGRHVPTGVEWIPPTKSQKIAEYVKDNIVTIRSYGSKPFDIFRKTMAGIDENNLEKALEDSKRHPSADRIGTFISNIDKRHSYQSGQWSAVHSIIPELKDKGILLLYQRDNPEAATNEIDHCYVLCLHCLLHALINTFWALMENMGCRTMGLVCSQAQHSTSQGLVAPQLLPSLTEKLKILFYSLFDRSLIMCHVRILIAVMHINTSVSRITKVSEDTHHALLTAHTGLSL